MEKQNISIKFKKSVSKIIDDFFLELEKNRSSLVTPSQMMMAKIARTNFFDPMSGKHLTETFIRESYPIWDLMYEKNEKALAVFFKDLIIHRYPVFSSFISDDMVRQLLDKEKRPLSEQYVTKTWDRIHNLVRMSIQYVHFSRCPKEKPDGTQGYTCRYEPRISVIKETEKWSFPKKNY